MAAENLHILIVDDAAEFRADLRQMLTYASAGACCFHEANTGTLGISLSRDLGPRGPDCVLVNYTLPDMTAKDFLTQLRADPNMLPFPVVVVGTDKNADGRALIREGAQDYVGKTWLTSSSLLRVIDNAIERFALISENKRNQSQLAENEARLKTLLAQSENRRLELEALMEAVPAQVWISRDRECRRMVGNKAVYDFLQMARGMNVSQTAPPSEQPEAFQTYRNGVVVPLEDLPMQKAARTGVAIRGVDLELRFTDGSSKWIYGNAEPLRDVEGNLCGAVAGMIDFTEHKRAHDQLAQQERRLRAMLNAIDHPLGILTPEGRVLEANPPLGGSSGSDGEVAASSLGAPLWDVPLYRSTPGIRSLLEPALRDAAGGRHVQLKLALRVHPDEPKHRSLELILHPIRDPEGRVVFLVHEGRDLPE